MTNMTALRPDIMISLDSSGIVTDAVLANAISSETASDWIGARWTDTVDNDEVPQIRSMFETARTSGVSAFGQIRQRFPSGLELPVRVRDRQGGGAARLSGRRKKRSGGR